MSEVRGGSDTHWLEHKAQVVVIVEVVDQLDDVRVCIALAMRGQLRGHSQAARGGCGVSSGGTVKQHEVAVIAPMNAG